MVNLTKTNSVSSKQIANSFRFFLLALIVSALAAPGFSKDTDIQSKHSAEIKKSGQAAAVTIKKLGGVSAMGNLFAMVKELHPLVIAAMQVFVVIGICILMTDNKELELYFKIDFKPPKTDILN